MISDGILVYVLAAAFVAMFVFYYWTQRQLTKALNFIASKELMTEYKGTQPLNDTDEEEEIVETK